MRDLVYRALRDAIVRGELPAGQPIPEDHLAQQLNVSRTPLREAMRSLEHDRLVIRAANGRLWVAPLTEAEARQLFAVRIALEELAISEACERLTREELDRMEATLEAMAMPAPMGDARRALDEGSMFHGIVNRASGNTINAEILSQLQLRIDRYRMLGTRTRPARLDNAHDEHVLILGALRQHDATLAREALRVHLSHALDSVLTALSGSGAAPYDEIAQSGPKRK